MNNNKEIGLYIHIPFCKSKCHYCDFNSYAGLDNLIEPYFASLQKEIINYEQRLYNYTVKSIFIGGGTPSFVSPQNIYQIVMLCRKVFKVCEKAEISLESNPGTLTGEKLAVYKAAGINRLSIGLQAWQQHLLKKMGRIHSSDDYVNNLKEAQKAGFNNINTDLIFGIPGQNMKDWKETLKNVVGLGTRHISAYSLKIEKDTVFGRMKDKGELVPMEDELDRIMYHYTVGELERKAFKHYEISNFSMSGFECEHNLIYWRAEEYIGVGAGSHSYLDDKRYNNIYSVKDYISYIGNDKIIFENEEVIDKTGKMSEYMILGLRLIKGVDGDEFESRFGRNIFSVFDRQLDTLKKRKLISIEKNRIKLTHLGLDLANQAFMEFLG